MKRSIVLIAASLLIAGAAFAVPYSSITPKTAKSMAMGGVFSSVPTAEFSFFGNPADFASKQATLVLTSVDAWAYLRPTVANVSGLIDSATKMNSAGGKSAFLSDAFGLMSENGGTGGGVSAGLGYAGKGLGLGTFVSTDEYIEGTNPASAVVHSDTQATIVMGLGVPLQLGDLRLSLGGDLRPFYRVSLFGADHADLALADLLAKMKDSSAKITDSIYSDAFFGMAMDLGATLQIGSLTTGLSIRDIAPGYPIASSSLTTLGDTLSAGSMPDTSASTASAAFTPNVTAGLSWAPRLLPGIIDPTVYFEIQDPVSVVKNWDGFGSAVNLLHAGAEVKLLGFMMLRGGINRGWLSAGAGFKLFFVDVNAAIFTEELGALPGDNPRSGLAVQAAIRF
jgi:hypothetical protein